MCSLGLFKARSAGAGSQAALLRGISRRLLHTDRFATPASSSAAVFPAHNKQHLIQPSHTLSDVPEKQGRQPTHGAWWYTNPGSGPRSYPSLTLHLNHQS